MKKTCACAVVAAAVALTWGMAGAGAAVSNANASAATVAQSAPPAEASAFSDSFTQSNAWNKVGANLQQAYLAAAKAGFPAGQRLTCFVRANEAIMDGDQSFLTSNGFIVQVASGSTARGQMALKDLPAVANLPFVKQIDTVQ